VPAAAARIEQLARDSVRIPDPETALRALGALRRELDETESELVIRALQTGASWAHIARALGVSKQAAHRKHRHLADQLHLTPAEGGSKILVTVEARRAIQFAREGRFDSICLHGDSPGAAEVAANPRSGSARLRAAVKVS